MPEKFEYQCCTCNKVYRQNEVHYLCPECEKHNTTQNPPRGVLQIRYKNMQFNDSESCMLSSENLYFEELKMNQFIDILPINNIQSLPPLRIGETPLYIRESFNGKALNHRLIFKDDSQNPTWSFKDRASALVSAYAKENGIDTIVAASTGNAGSSLAGICASQRQKAIILVPEKAPIAKLSQIVMYGAKLVPVQGTYDDAFDLSVKASKEFGWYNRNTAFNPLTIEGKKTVAFEIFDQLDYRLPDRIFVPVGDGVIISGVYKGFEDLLNLGIIHKMPVIVAVQANGSNNLIRNLNTNDFIIEESSTIADSISVDIPRNYYMAKDFLLKYKGETLSVSDDDILQASVELSGNTGLFAEPAAAASFAGYLKYLNNNKLPEGSSNLVLLTGSGLKDIKSITNLIKMPVSVPANIDGLMKSLKI